MNNHKDIEVKRELIERAGRSGFCSGSDTGEDFRLKVADAHEICCGRGINNCFFHEGDRSFVDGIRDEPSGAKEISSPAVFVKMVAYSAKAGSELAETVSEFFMEAVKNEEEECRISDSHKLFEIAEIYGVAIRKENRILQAPEQSLGEIASKVGEKALCQRERGSSAYWFTRLPRGCQDILKKNGILPRSIKGNIIDLIEQASDPGAESNMKSLLIKSSAVALAYGWGSSMAATDLQDALFGAPFPVKGSSGIGALKKEKVNILINGKDSFLGEMIVKVSKIKEMQNLAGERGAEGIQVSGMGCAGNELLMRHGIPLIDRLQLEISLNTGAVEVLVSDFDKRMKYIKKSAGPFHTKVFSTETPGSPASGGGINNSVSAVRESFQYAKKIVKTAIENFSNRKSGVTIPDELSDLVSGFSCEAVRHSLGGTFRASYKFLVENILNGRIRGICIFSGSNSPSKKIDEGNVNIVKELLKQDIIVLTTGCIMTTLSDQNLLNPDYAGSFCGPGLYEVCTALGIPPVLHMGSCTNNSRILSTLNELVREAGLNSISDLPVAVYLTGWTGGADFCIGQCFAASGLYTAYGRRIHVSQRSSLKDFLCKGMEEIFGGMWDFDKEPGILCQRMLAHIDKKREKLGVNGVCARVLVGMEERRGIQQK
ncbi:MAG: carbon monoxide dehydrogenase [Deltaproteobacteria bacterium]|nr:carbon monoxide dehydrogenase [Deltaproteobacteria bacterium]